MTEGLFVTQLSSNEGNLSLTNCMGREKIAVSFARRLRGLAEVESSYFCKIWHQKGRILTLILRRSRTGTVWFYTSTSNKRAARPKLYTKSLTRDLKLMYSRLTLVRISISLLAPRVLYIGTGVSLLSRERFLYI